MLQLVHSIDRASIAETWFATLTYPEQHCPTWATIERDRRAWAKRFFRQFGKDRAFLVWKKEQTKRGTVHLHALIFWVKGPHLVPRLKGPAGFWAWNDRAWAETANTGHPDHQRVACKVVPMHSWSGVGSYCAKYLAKPQDGTREDTGRIWGVENRKLAATVTRHDHQHLPRAAGVRFRRTCRKLQSRRRESWWRLVSDPALGLHRWVKLYPRPGLPVSDQVSRALADGVRVKRTRPTCLTRRTSTIWAETVTTSAALAREVRQVEPVGTEHHSFASSLHFIREDTARALALHCMERWLEDLEREQELPI